MDRALADCECYGCDRPLRNPNHQGTHYTKRDGGVAFRCYVCGRFFCNDCAAEHFDLAD